MPFLPVRPVNDWGHKIDPHSYRRRQSKSPISYESTEVKYEQKKEAISTENERRSYSISLREAFHIAVESSDHISVNDNIMAGAPCISSSRIPVYMIMDAIEYHGTIQGVQDSYPQLTEEQIYAALHFAKIVVECPLDDQTCSITG